MAVILIAKYVKYHTGVTWPYFPHYWHFVRALQWRRNERGSVSNHQRLRYLLNFRYSRRSKKTSKLRVTGFCVGNSITNNTENVPIWWRHHGNSLITSEFAVLVVCLLFDLEQTTDWLLKCDAVWRHPNEKLIELIVPSCRESPCKGRDISISYCQLQWRHNEPDNVSNHRRLDCLLNRLFRLRSKETSKLRVTGLCAGNSPVIGEFPAQRASNAENVSITWRHHGINDGCRCLSDTRGY